MGMQDDEEEKMQIALLDSTFATILPEPPAPFGQRA
jgi:hypothetical protein